MIDKIPGTVIAVMMMSVMLGAFACAETIDVGSQRQLFVDRYVIEIQRDVVLKLHEPVRQPLADSPLPSRFYMTVLKDEDQAGVLYWRGVDPSYEGETYSGHPGELVRYAESRGGHEWDMPSLGMHEIAGTRNNNVVLADMPPLLHNFSPFIDILFMTSRAGSQRFDRLFKQAYMWPGRDVRRWGNRANYVAFNVVPTGDDEMSIYHKSGHRYTLRTDGFVSLHAGHVQGELVTKPMRFDGDSLELNYRTSAGGSLRVEVLDARGQAIPGFALEDGPLLVGDEIERVVWWAGGLSALQDQAVRLRFVLRECDLYAFRFR